MTDAADIVEAMGEDLSRFTTRLGARSVRLANEAVSDLRTSLAEPHLGTWGESSRYAAMAVINKGVADLQARQAALLTGEVPAIARASHGRLVSLLTVLDKQYSGSVRPLSFAPLAWLEAQSAGLGQIRLREYGRSFARYGAAAVTEIEEAVAKLALTGQPWTRAREQVWLAVRDVVGDKQWMVDRILRTETSAVYNGTALAALLEEDTPAAPMLKRLVSTFDSRTGRDSVAVHGQVRPVREPFFDPVGGRSYMAPPNRPHDREILVPHRAEWGERLPVLVRPPPPALRGETSAPELPPARPVPRPERRPPARPSLLAAVALVTLLAGRVQETRRAARVLPAPDRGPLDLQQRALAEQLRQAQVKLALERLAEDVEGVRVGSLRPGDVLSAGGVEVRVVALGGGLALQIGETRVPLAMSASAALPLRRIVPVVRAVLPSEAVAVFAAIVAATPGASISRAA